MENVQQKIAQRWAQYDPDHTIRMISKVLGADSTNILFLLSGSFLRLILIAMLIALKAAVSNPIKSLKVE